MRTFFTYCCVSVDAPCRLFDARLTTTARAMPSTSTPPWPKKRLSSIATIAFCIGSEISSSGTTTRFWM